jgi:hypothetical protein
LYELSINLRNVARSARLIDIHPGGAFDYPKARNDKLSPESLIVASAANLHQNLTYKL